MAHKKSKKRKLSDIQEPAQVTEDIFTEEDYPTDKSGQEENNVVETEKEEEECDNNQTQEDNNSRESDKDHVVNNTEDTLNGNVDNGHLDSTLQEERMTLSTDDHNNPEYSNTPLTHNRIEVVSSIRIRPTILESLDKPPEPPEPPKSSFISRLLNLHKNKASKTTTETTEASKTIETTETETAASTQVNDACTTETIQHVVEADNKSMDNQTLDDAECSDTRNEKDDIVVSEVVPEPRLRFQSKKKKTQVFKQLLLCV